MSLSVAVQKGSRYGWVVVCSTCGVVARRELEIDAETKALRHEREHRSTERSVA